MCVPYGHKNRAFEGLIEPINRDIKIDRPLVARTVVQSNEFVPVRLMNVKPEVHVVYKGTTIGQINEIDSVSYPTNESHAKCLSKSLRPDLQDLLERASKNLTPSQADKLRMLLQKYESSFAESENDLGRTSIVKHHIDTGDARPVKEPPRRTPVHLRQEVDKNIDDMLSRGVI